jgi:ribosome assembly protein YihI (activator of Der GTPase)
MFNEEMFADFYGSFSLDEVAERLDMTTTELVEYFWDEIDQTSDALAEEMGINDDDENEEDEE